jgi:CheY-like chemotaxis protein
VGGAKVLVVDDDDDIAELVQAVLTDEGYDVSVLARARPEELRAAVGRLEPDCILLDGGGPLGYGASWAEAAGLHARVRPVPVVMFTVHQAATREAGEGLSERSRAARFAAILPKPFPLEDLLEAVARAAAQSVPFNRSAGGDARRTRALVERLEAGGARDVQASARREWVTFRAPDDGLVQLYWWQQAGVYYVGRYAPDGAVMQTVGRFHDVEAAVSAALAG